MFINKLAGRRASGMNLHSGFTLIELLVVVLIIGILSSIALPQYTKAVEKARAAEAFSLMGSVRQALDAYMLSGQADVELCTTNSPLDIELPGISEDSTECETKNFRYDGDCSTASCRFRANRMAGDVRHYSLFQEKTSASAPWTFHCNVYTDAGWAVCNGLTSQGWTVSDNR